MVKRPQSKSRTNAGQVRIISGQWRGRRLPVADVQGLRPTTDRVRETLFNWLMHDIQGARVLDCFSGSGALGFEALSRWAEYAELFEMDAKVSKQLQNNLKTLGANNAKVRQGDTLKLLSTAPSQGFDLIFIDPPFRRDLIAPTLERLQQGWLAQGALIYLECEQECHPELPESWQVLKQKQAGQVIYRLIQT
ncbi:16S rRNA (guanine(966)-N(2))-methyltransferase RsmD [Paraferrimonas sedimenticola]|uniref:Ribosomal RNA small subunit methyltransferase D n=1 Tax=Paraferrimonas sedimenticola TaxID=375674 RepID=A0AA37RYV8_9GAMM|nr:16S rRNA (guanine(966)-N(2))-methyltransferase RsmD [Paraferrimonas sedimenticola]GLP97818.1 ribosomal RNA small subunit methyltransferase D [Paraferrimonas sedimenticola]